MQSIITHKYKPRQHVYVHTHTLPGRFFQPFIIYLNPSYIQRVYIRFSYPLNTLGYTNTKTHMCTYIPAWTYTFSAKRWFSIFLWPVTILGELRHLCSRLFSEPSLAMQETSIQGARRSSRDLRIFWMFHACLWAAEKWARISPFTNQVNTSRKTTLISDSRRSLPELFT